MFFNMHHGDMLVQTINLSAHYFQSLAEQQGNSKIVVQTSEKLIPKRLNLDLDRELLDAVFQNYANTEYI